MIYLKKNIGNEAEIKVNICGDEFYCTCPDCGREVQLDSETLKEIICDDKYDFASTSVYCEDCSKHHIGSCNIPMNNIQTMYFSYLNSNFIS